jgi:Tol biopolymer transport system component
MSRRMQPLKRTMPAAFCSCLLALLSPTVVAQPASTDQPMLQGKPHLFAPGVISDQDAEANASFTPDDKTVYFAKHNPGWARDTIVESHRIGDGWSEPEVAPFSGIWKDTDPSVSPDGTKLFFASTRPTDGSNTPRTDYDLWYVERTADGGWGEPKHIDGPVNSDASEAYPSVTKDGTLYFESSRSGRGAIYRSQLVNGEYGAPQLLPFCNQGNDVNPIVASDDSFVIFFSTDRGGLGSADLFVSFHRKDGRWSVPKNLGAPINSKFFESAPGLSPDNRTLYFASDRIDAPLTRTHRVNYQELEGELHAIQNGLSKIYEVDISDLRRLDDAP